MSKHRSQSRAQHQPRYARCCTQRDVIRSHHPKCYQSRSDAGTAAGPLGAKSEAGSPPSGSVHTAMSEMSISGVTPPNTTTCCCWAEPVISTAECANRAPGWYPLA
eukprot:CAMPEP_0118959986 /NCGR_PEP_ID=MMETSP1169-20130426/63409_1 /TAXON_ID=36882 /ORGANISM="Pyramimonas obovata, Strain CCMP722" /LENGTH=105 /DNA_ID=CAMNT_0006908129 /DNA_START=20 /DNA_END=337 /DNA_ORIENTATION=+